MTATRIDKAARVKTLHQAFTGALYDAPMNEVAPHNAH